MRCDGGGFFLDSFLFATEHGNMGLDNQAKIIILLGIDIVFFFIEIISGYAVGSLALVADSFHMLNDIMSLVVALYAVRLVKKGGKSPQYSYG